MDRLSFAAPDDLLEAIAERARRDGVSRGQAVRDAVSRGLGRQPFPDESPLEEARRLLAERAREGSVTAAVELSRQLGNAASSPPPAGDFLDELAARRKQ